MSGIALPLRFFPFLGTFFMLKIKWLHGYKKQLKHSCEGSRCPGNCPRCSPASTACRVGTSRTEPGLSRGSGQRPPRSPGGAGLGPRAALGSRSPASASDWRRARRPRPPLAPRAAVALAIGCRRVPLGTAVAGGGGEAAGPILCWRRRRRRHHGELRRAARPAWGRAASAVGGTG